MNIITLKYKPKETIKNLFKSLFLLCCCIVLISVRTHYLSPIIGIIGLSFPICILIDLIKCNIIGSNYIELSNEGVNISLTFSSKHYKWDELLYVGFKIIGNRKYLSFEHIDDYLNMKFTNIKKILFYFKKSTIISLDKINENTAQEIINFHHKNQNHQVISQLLSDAKSSRQNT